jgi:hypothetical protein
LVAFHDSPVSGTRARAGSDLKAACAAGDVAAGSAAADVLCKTSRDGHVLDILLEACHDACVAAAADALAQRDPSAPLIAHLRKSFDAVVTTLQVRGAWFSFSRLCLQLYSHWCSGCLPRHLLSTGLSSQYWFFLLLSALCFCSGMVSSYEKLCVMVMSSLQPRLQTFVQALVDAAAASTAAAAAADISGDDVTPNSPARSSAAAAAILDASRALCSLACSFLALHPDAHFSEAGCRRGPKKPLSTVENRFDVLLALQVSS